MDKMNKKYMKVLLELQKVRLENQIILYGATDLKIELSIVENCIKELREV